MKAKKVYFIGAGPGKADLITLRGLNILREAQVVIYDYLVDKGILENVKRGAELICCDNLAKKGRYSDGFLIHQQRITDLLVKKVKAGKKVVRLKNGDPAIFSRLSQEIEALAKDKIGFEVVPGVSAASAAAAFSGIPLTDRRFASSCVFAAGHEAAHRKKSNLDWQALAKSGTIVLYMAVENLQEIAGKLISAGMDKKTPAAIIQDASLAAQRTVKGALGDIAQKAKEHRISPPAIVIVGGVAGGGLKRQKKNKRVLFTGLSPERYFLSQDYQHLPLIKIEPLKDYREFDGHLKRISSFDWVVFCSRYGVRYFFKRLKLIGYDARALAGIKIAAVGESTKRALAHNVISADLVPETESAGGLIKAFSRMGIKGKKVFLPRSDISDKGLETGLKGLGAEVVSAYAYKNAMPQELPGLDLNSFGEIIFSSPSTVRNFKKKYTKAPKGVKISCIGEVTLREAKRCGFLS